MSRFALGIAVMAAIQCALAQEWGCFALDICIAAINVTFIINDYQIKKVR